MSKLNKKALVGIIAGVAIVVVAAVVSVVVVATRPRGMVAAVSTLPDSLNPILEQNTMGLNVDELIYDGLTNFEVDLDSGKLYTEFALAESIEQDTKTRKTYTITLRDVQWHDGTPVTSADVVYSYKAYVLEENESPKRDYLNSFISDVVEVDDKTLTVEFKNPIPEFRAYPVLTFKIIPANYNGQAMDVNMRSGENERAFATKPVGTGPFKFAKWDIGKDITFEANGLYFKTVPKADTLTIKRTIDPIVRLNELRKGRINLILETNPMDRPKIQKIEEVDINSYMPYAFYEVAINTKFFPNAEGRQAMAQAIDKKNLIPEITDQEDGVVINNGPFPSNLFATNIPEYVSDPMPNLLPYDIDAAKKLAVAGGIEGQNAILIYPDSMGEFGKQLAEGIAKQLSEIGLNVEARRTGNQVFDRTVYKEKSFELALMYREGFDNVYSSIGSMYRSDGAENVTGIADSKLNELFDAWENEVKTSEWVKYTLQIDERVNELCPALNLFSLQKEVYSRGIGNVVIATDNPFLSAEDWVFTK